MLDEKALAKGGYGGIIGVGQGSAKPPRLVRLGLHGTRRRKQHLALVGKGITFDTGGISLKPANAMDTMKSRHGRRGRGVRRHASPWPSWTCRSTSPRTCRWPRTCPAAARCRPSDVLTMYGGKTVEVLNTDAEGRLVLADALARAGEDQPDVLVDVATLTGAQVLALGTGCRAVMANDDELRTRIVETADGGRRGDVADAAAASTCARPSTPRSPTWPTWATADGRDAGRRAVPARVRRRGHPVGAPGHRGPSFNEKGAYGYTPKGGTGAAVRTLVQLAEDMGAGK